jgi:hypothetical protein
MVKYASSDVHRLYPYIYGIGFSSTGAYLSVYFEDLNAITDFRNFLHYRTAAFIGIQIYARHIYIYSDRNGSHLLGIVLYPMLKEKSLHRPGVDFFSY